MKIKDINEENKNYQSNLILKNEGGEELEKIKTDETKLINKNEENMETDQGNNYIIFYI